MNSVCVKVNPPYSIIFQKGGLKDIGKFVGQATKAKRLLVVSDTNVAPLYLELVKNSLISEGFDVSEFIFGAGEQSKNVDTYLKIIDDLAKKSFKRTDAVVALGGGVVGDIAGFAAATYMRGIDVMQVPTTLLAMTDSAIGGKTGVDLPEGKNLLGAFHQPKLVFVDVNVLLSLPEREWQNGLGEGAKYACLAGGRIADIMSSGSVKDNIEEYIELCAKYKVDIVVNDEKESGQRALLNLGHTVGHAIEKASEFKIAHGVAVAEGVAIMARAAHRHGKLCDEDYQKINDILKKIEVNAIPEIDRHTFGFVAMDKKASGTNDISVVVINSLGDCVVKKMSIAEFENYIS